MPTFKMKHINPEGLFKSKAFSQAITVTGKAKTIYIGGQNAINSKGELIGVGDLELQTKQTLHNIKTILATENASFANLVKLNIYLVSGSDERDPVRIANVRAYVHVRTALYVRACGSS
ncbi:RidA family protein [Paenibacillus sp. NPDC055715]